MGASAEEAYSDNSTAAVEVAADNRREGAAAVAVAVADSHMEAAEVAAGVGIVAEAAVAVGAAFVHLSARSEMNRNSRSTERRIPREHRNLDMKTFAAFYKFLLFIFRYSLCLYNVIFKTFGLPCIKIEPYRYHSAPI